METLERPRIVTMMRRWHSGRGSAKQMRDSDTRKERERNESGGSSLHDVSLDSASVWNLLDSSPDGMLVCDSAGVIVVVNRQLEVMSGYDRTELLGQTIEMLVPQENRSRHEVDRLHFVASPQVRPMARSMDLSLRRSDGCDVAVEIALAPVELGSEIFVSASVRDVRERRIDDLARRRLLGLLDHVPEAIFIVQPDATSFEYVNNGAESLLGYAEGELLSLHPERVFPTWSTILEPLCHDSESGTVGAPTTFALLLNKSGLPIHCEVRTVRTEKASDNTFTYVIVATDDRERRSAMQQLRTSEEAFRAAFENAPVGMVLTEIDEDQHRSIVRVNEAFAKFLGRSCEELVGMSPLEFSHPDDDALDQAATNAQISGISQCYSLEKRYRRKDGSYVWGELHSSLLPPATSPDPCAQNNFEHRVRLSHVVDVSERRIESDRRKQMEQCQQSLKEAAVALFGGIDHDTVIRTIVADLEAMFDVTATVTNRDGDGEGPAQHGVSKSGCSYDVQIDSKILTIPFTAAASDGTLRVKTVSLRRPNEGKPFNESDRLVLEVYADQLSSLFTLSSNRRTHERMEVLEDRERIAHALVSTVVQDLFETSMQINSVISQTRDASLAERFVPVVAKIDRTIEHLRAIVFNL